MPARRLNAIAAPISMFDVVGIDSQAEPEFIRHVGLCKIPRSDLSNSSPNVLLVHMGPPLIAGQSLPVETSGWIELTVDNIRQIELFIQELESEYLAQKARKNIQYTIHPHVVEPDFRIPFKRFSCVGFVIEAYKDAGIILLDQDNKSVPVVSLDTMKKAYPDLARKLDSEKIRTLYGLVGVGPWPVILAGYVINALNRSSEEIYDGPYFPKAGDEYFPPKP